MCATSHRDRSCEPNFLRIKAGLVLRHEAQLPLAVSTLQHFRDSGEDWQSDQVRQLRTRARWTALILCQWDCKHPNVIFGALRLLKGDVTGITGTKRPRFPRAGAGSGPRNSGGQGAAVPGSAADPGSCPLSPSKFEYAGPRPSRR